MRQRKVRLEPKRTNASRPLSAAVFLAVSLVLSLSPFVTTPVAAAPPDTIREATSDITPESGTGTDKSLTAETPQLPDQLVGVIAPRDVVNGGDGSVRPRGIEAPVQLERKEAQGGERRQEDDKSPGKPEKAENVGPDPGDGPVRKRQEAAKERKREQARERSDIRIWPMPAKSYTFTQEFGCVPQLGSLYFPGEGCPASAPVIHTGVDLAAPEGTPFYAAASGWVTLADYDRPTADANTRIIIQHDGRNEGYATDYLHWVASYVKEGDYVHAGDPIGEVGNVGFSTGPHLHFSVTDLDTGEFIDPLRWLPREPGLEGYVRRTPAARLRLPAGTTAGQPESADPAPPPPAVKEKVPKSPPGDGKQGEGKRGGRDAKAGKEPAASDAKRSDKKPSRRNTASETNANEPTSDGKNDRDGSPSREPSRKRNKDGSSPAETAGGDNGASRDERDESSKADRRANREANKDSKDAGGAGKEEPEQEPSRRSARDNGGPDSTGRDEQGRRGDGGGDRQTSDQRRSDGGNGGNRERHRTSREAASEPASRRIKLAPTFPRNSYTDRPSRYSRSRS